MHLIFTDEERMWCKTDEIGWPIKSGCPEKIKKSIEHKKEVLNTQDRKARTRTK